MAEGSSGTEQSELSKSGVVTSFDNKPEIPQANPITRKNLLARLIPTLRPPKVTEQVKDYSRRSVLGRHFEYLDAQDHLDSVLRKSRAIRTNSNLRLNAVRLNAEGVSEKSIIEVLEKGDKASERAVDEVFTGFIRNYAEAGKLSAEKPNEDVESIWVGKSVVNIIGELEKRIPKKAVAILLTEIDSWKKFVNLVKLSNEELLVQSPEILPTINKDFNLITIHEEAKKYFSLRLSQNKRFTPEQREEALKTLEKWYTGNYSAETGKLTLYRFVHLTPEMLNDVTQNGIMPRGVQTFGSEDAALKYLEENAGGLHTILANAFKGQKSGEDISELVEEYKKDSRSRYDYDLATYWTTEAESRLFGGEGYRIALELDPRETWRATTFKSIKKGRIDDSDFLSTISFDDFSNGQFEWTVLGNIPNSKIKEITDLSSKREVFRRNKTPQN